MLIRKGQRDVVPCGKCNFCLQVKRADWSFRLQNELRHSDSGVFITLTYDEDNVPYADVDNFRRPTLVKRHCQLFMKRLRKYDAKSKGVFFRPVRYYLVGEYGTRSNRPHYHAIVFNLCADAVDALPKIWKCGGVHVGKVTPASIHYTTKYFINRPGEWEGYEKPFALMSLKPGLGNDYVSTHKCWHRNTEDVTSMRYYTQVGGVKARLPRYYKDRIFTSVERQILANMAVPIADEAYLAEIDRLSSLVRNPVDYYDEREVHAHDKVVSKVNATNTF